MAASAADTHAGAATVASEPASPKRYSCRTRLIAGVGSLSVLEAELAALKATRPVLVADSGVAQAGLIERWLPSRFHGDGPILRILAGVNPTSVAVEEATAKARAAQCDSVIILGGGSALCLGKAVGVLLANPGRILDFEGSGRVPRAPVPTIAIPTTAGSGSEVSNALVLHDPARPVEVVVRGPGLEPDIAILDATVLAELPRQALLFAALDALSHACEALWVKPRTVMTDAMAEKALRTILDVLPEAMERREPAMLQKLLEASTAANLACGNSGLGLIHALTTAPSVPLAHGYQNGCVLLAVAEFSKPSLEAAHAELIARVSDLFRRIGWPGRFAPGDVDKTRSEAMVRASTGHPFRKNHARPSSDAELFEILRASGADC